MDKPTITLARNKCYVDGQWVGEPKLPVTNKATGDIMARVPDFGEAETRAAIEAANRALPGWSKLLAKERARLVRRWYDLIVEHADELALLLTNEQGKPLAEAKGEILYAAGFIEFAAEEAKRIYGETIPTFKADARVVVIKQPVGVVAAITPWNFPAAMITRKAGPALAVGCTMVLKPASETPLYRAGAGGARRAGRHTEGRVQRHHRQGQRDRQGADRQPAGAHAHLHRVDRYRPRADGAVRAHHQEARARARGQCALHRLRRRRPRQGGGRRHGLQVSQRRPDLRLRQPHLRAGGRLRRVRREALPASEEDEGRRRDRGGRHHRAADQQGRGREGRGARGRCLEARRQGDPRRQAARARRQLLRADHPGRTSPPT